MESAGPPPHPGSAPSLSRRFRLLLVGLILARGMAELCVMPPFEGWDEYQHVGYVVHVLETGRRATLGETLVPASLRAEMAAFPQPRSSLAQMGPHPAEMGYADYWARRGSGLVRSPGRVDPPASTEAASPIKLYQAQHSWWYYRTVAPLFAAAGGVSDLRDSMAVLRLVNLLLTAGAVWIATGVIAHRVRSRRTAAWIGLVIAVHPIFLTNGVRVSSDAPGVFLATLTVAVALALDGRLSIRRSGAMGLIAGAAILAKATNWSLVPFLAGCWLFAATRGEASRRRAAGSALALFLGLAAVVGPEVGHNLAVYGVPTPMQEAVLNHRNGRGLLDLLRTAASVSWPREARDLWLRGAFLTGGWSFVGKGVPGRDAYYWAAAAGLLGWAWRLIAVAAGRRMRGGSVRLGGGRFRLHAPRRSARNPPSIRPGRPWRASCSAPASRPPWTIIPSNAGWPGADRRPAPGTPRPPCPGSWRWSSRGRWRGPRAGWARRSPRRSPARASSASSSCYGRGCSPPTRAALSGCDALRRIGQLQPTLLGPATALAATAAGGVILLVAAVAIARIPAVGEDPAIESTRGPHRSTVSMPIEAPGDPAESDTGRMPVPRRPIAVTPARRRRRRRRRHPRACPGFFAASTIDLNHGRAVPGGAMRRPGRGDRGVQPREAEEPRMLLDLRCPSCGYTQRASDAVFGKTVMCPSCSGTFPVPRPSAPIEPRRPPLPAGPPRLEAATARAGAPEGQRKAVPRREGLPPWIHAAIGGTGALILVCFIILIRSLAAPGTTSGAGAGHPADAGRGGDRDRTAAATPEPAPAPAARPAPAPEPGPAGPATLSTAQIVARCEPSVALVKGRVSSGTGFLVRPGLVATNAHVIDDEFLPDLEVRFPSAPAGQRGPIPADLLYEDPGATWPSWPSGPACPRWRWRGRTDSSRARISP